MRDVGTLLRVGITRAKRDGGAGLDPEDRVKIDSILDLSQPAAVFDGMLRFDTPKHMQHNGPGRCVLALDKATTIVPNTTIVVRLRGTTLLSAPPIFGGDAPTADVDYPAAWDFTPGGNADLIITAMSATSFVSTFKAVSEVDAAPPTIVSATVSDDAYDELVVTCSDRMKCPSVAGLAVANPTRAISSLISGDGTKTLRFQISADLDAEDEPDLVVSANRTLQELNGNLISTGTTAIDVEGGGGGGHTTASLPNLTLLMQASTGSTGVADGAAVTTWNSAVASRTLTGSSGARPTLDVDGVDAQYPSVNWDGTDDVMATTATIGDLTGGGTDFYTCGMGRITAATATAAGYNIAHAVYSDAVGYMALNFYLNGGTIRFVAFQYGSTNRQTSGGSVAIGADFYWAVRHDATNGLRLYVNGSLVGSVAGATEAISGPSNAMRFGQNVGSVFAGMRIAEMAFCSADPGDTLHDAQMAYYASLLA